MALFRETTVNWNASVLSRHTHTLKEEAGKWGIYANYIFMFTLSRLTYMVVGEILPLAWSIDINNNQNFCV